MNQDSNSCQNRSADSFVDAALRERARLSGSNSDRELVNSILEATTNRPLLREVAPRPRVLYSWVAGACAGAAAVAMLAAILTSVPSSTNTTPVEQSFTVTFQPYQSTSSDDTANSKSNRLNTFASPKRFEESFEIAIRPTPAISTPNSDESPEMMDSATFLVAADSAEQKGDARLYTGSVNLRRGNLKIEAASVQVASVLGDSNGAAAFIASDVKLSQATPLREARAETLRYEPASGDFVLTGVQTFTTENGEFRNLDPADKLVIAEGSFTVRAHTKAVTGSR